MNNKIKDVIVKYWVYLTQRDNVDTLDDNRKPEPSNQCMIASFGMWAIQFGYFANLEKWVRQFNPQSIEDLIHTIVQTHVNQVNEPVTRQIEILRKSNANPNMFKELAKKLTSRFHSYHFIEIFNKILKDYGWKLVSERATIERIRQIIDTGQSVVCGTNITKLKGASGHIQNFVGYRLDEQGNFAGFYSCDPYGNYETLYKDHNGSCVLYNADTVIGLLSPCSAGDIRLMIYAVKI